MYPQETLYFAYTLYVILIQEEYTVVQYFCISNIKLDPYEEAM